MGVESVAEFLGKVLIPAAPRNSPDRLKNSRRDKGLIGITAQPSSLTCHEQWINESGNFGFGMCPKQPSVFYAIGTEEDNRGSQASEGQISLELLGIIGVNIKINEVYQFTIFIFHLVHQRSHR